MNLQTEDTITLHRSALDLLPVIVLFFVSVVGMIFLSIEFPGSIQSADLGKIGETAIVIPVPGFALPPIILFFYIYHSLYNCRYIIAPDFVSQTEGLLSIRKVDRRLELSFIRGIEIDRSFLGRFTNVGDLKIGAAAQANIDLTFHGIRDPSYWRNIILERMHALEPQRNPAS